MRNILQIIDEMILMWWKPRGKNDNTFNCSRDKDGTGFVLISDFKESDMLYFKITDLVRRESGFWKFVVDRGWYVRTPGVITAYQELANIEWKNKHWPIRYKEREEYWLIESALRDESQLESFITKSVMTKSKIKECINSYVKWNGSIKEISDITGWNDVLIENVLRKPKDTYNFWSKGAVNLTQQEEQFINTAISNAIDEMEFRSNIKVTIEQDEI